MKNSFDDSESNFPLGVLLPAYIHLKPWMASAAMALSSLSVLFSSLLLRYFRKPQKKDYENRSFQKWLANTADGIEVHRGIDKVVGESRHTTPTSSRSGNGSKLSQLLVEAVSTFVKHGTKDKTKENTAKPNNNSIGLTVFKV